jgi:SAM-dependent methyltransferase
MNFFDLVDIAERDIELVNPISPEKVLQAGQAAGLRPGAQVVEFGCGYGEVLALWAAQFGIAGLGIEVRPKACERARRKMAARGLAGRIEIACGDAAGYPVPAGAYDLAACVGASFIWGGFQPALQNMRPALRAGGRIVIGEPYWRSAPLPPQAAPGGADFHTERALLEMIRAEALELEFVVRASQDDWDRYEAGNWQGLVRWLAENPQHPERGEVLAHLRASQEEYLGYGREHFGWALYVLGASKA